jgi:hypothetical protein
MSSRDIFKLLIRALSWCADARPIIILSPIFEVLFAWVWNRLCSRIAQ